MPNSPLDLIMKYAPQAATLIKDPSKLIKTMTNIGPALQTALRADPKSVQAQANTQVAKTSSTIAQKAQSALKSAYATEQVIESLPIKGAKTMVSGLKQQSLQVATHQIQLYQKKINTITQQLQVTKAAVLAGRGILNNVFKAQKDVIQAQKMLSQASVVKIPSGPTGTLAQQVKAIAAIAKAVSAAAKQAQVAVKTLNEATTTLKAAQTQLPKTQAQVSTSLQKLQQVVSQSL